MDDVYRVCDLIEELGQLPPDAPVMIAVVKHPAQFMDAFFTHPSNRWDLSTACEVHPLERGEVTLQEGLVYLATELTDFVEQQEQLEHHHD